MTIESLGRTYRGAATLAAYALAAFLVWGPAGDALARQAGPATSEPRPIRALYITGGGFHDFVAQKDIIPPGISARANVEWVIDITADTATAALIERHRDTRWAEEFDVVVYNMSFSWVVDPEWIARIAHAHRDTGVGAVILHGAVHSYRRSETDAWRELMGVSSYRHDSQREFSVEVLEPDHPIMKGFPQGWGPGVDELYNIQDTWPGMTPLARSYSVETESYHPVIWTNQYGNAKVFATTMGHHNRIMADPAYLDLVTRGLLWTLDKLQDDGTPAPGYGPRGESAAR